MSDYICDDGELLIDTPPVFLPLLDKRRYRGASGGRGSMKSWHFGQELILDCVAEHTRAVSGREIQLSIADSSKQLLEDTIRRYDFQGFVVKEKEIIYPETESLIIFRGFSNQTSTSIKSLEGFNRLHVDEAATLSQRSIDLVTPTFRKNSTMDFSWNPETPKDPIEKLFRDAGCEPNKPSPDPDFVWVHATYHDNPWFPDELRRDMERDRRRDIDKYNHTWLGRHKKVSKARVFHNWEIIEFDTPSVGPRFYFGGDWGFSVDPTCLIRAWQGKLLGDKAIPHPDGDKLFIDYEAYGVGVEIDNTPALFAGDDTRTPARWPNPYRFKGIPGATEWPLTADNARPETISYMKRHGFPQIKPSIKGKGSVEEGIEFIKMFDLVVHPRCKHVIEELSNYQFKIDKRTNEILPILDEQTYHANLIHALRYALEGTRRSNYTLSSVG